MITYCFALARFTLVGEVPGAVFEHLPGALLFRARWYAHSCHQLTDSWHLNSVKGGVIINKPLALLDFAVVTLATACSPSGSIYTGGLFACVEFRRIMAQGAEGNITDAETRERLEKVQARGSTAEPPIKDASTRVLATITSGDGPGFSTATEDMIKACTEAGY